MSRVAALWDEWAVEDRFGDALGPFLGGGEPASVTFPTTNLVTRVQIALGADLSADPLTWNWLDITEWVRHDLGISLTTGRRDEQTTVTTGSATLKLDNRDGRFTRRNPTGPYYGLLSKNTPIWATVDAGSGEKTRLEMFVNEWPKTWADKSATDSTVTIRCAGILRRLGQGQVALSPIRRAILASNPEAYWSLEVDGSPGAPNGIAMDVNDATFESVVSPAGIIGAATFSALTGHMSGPVVGVSGTSWHFEFTFFSVFGGLNPDIVFTCSTPGWALVRALLPDAVGNSFSVFAVNSAGSNIAIVALNSVPAGWDQNWHHVAVSYEQVGTGVAQTMHVDGVLVDSATQASVTLSAPTGVSYSYHTSPPVVDQDLTLAHIAVGSGPFGGYDAGAAIDAWAGEQAHARIARLCAEEGIPYQSSAPRSSAMGPQGVGTLLTLLREAEAVGGGVLYEKRWGLAYQSLAERYNAPIGLELDFDQGHIADIPEPADDDQRTRNRFTASLADGSEYTAEQTDGPMGTGAQGPGVYDDSATLNVETDDQLSSQAGWRLHLGQVDEDRWPDVGLDFTRNPDLIDTWCGFGYGARLTLANPLPQMPPDPPDLIIEGHSERWNSRQWRASLNCSPASAYRVHVVASTDGNLGRVDAANSTLVADVSDVATTISVASPGALWRTGAVNFDIEVGGERMTVTDISGGSSPQTFTVTRSVNGVVKAQSATVGGFATRVRLWRPGVVAL